MVYRISRALCGVLLPALIAAVISSCGGKTSSNGISAPLTEMDPAESISPGNDRDPGLGLAQALGFYSSGSLKNAEEFPDTGRGFMKLYLPRDRGWATRSLITVITQAAEAVEDLHPGRGRLQIGDASKQSGGYASGHASHQNGLDADLHYYHTNDKEMDPYDTRGFDESFVIKGKLSANFDVPRNWALMKALVASGKISRIFMDPVIKRAFCAYRGEPGARPVLSKLRPLSKHDRHCHVRLDCPSNSKSCVPQGKLPTSDGCAETTSALELAATNSSEFGDDQ